MCAVGSSALQRRRSQLLGPEGSQQLLQSVKGIFDSYGVHADSICLSFTVDSSNAVFRHSLLSLPTSQSFPIANLSLTSRQLQCMGIADSQPLSRNALVSISSVQGKIVGDKTGTFATFYEIHQARLAFHEYLRREFGLDIYHIEPSKAGLRPGWCFLCMSISL